MTKFDVYQNETQKAHIGKKGNKNHILGVQCI